MSTLSGFSAQRLFSRSARKRGETITAESSPSPPPGALKVKFDIPDPILTGDTTDIYFSRAKEILDKEGLTPNATMEFFPRSAGILCGIQEALQLLDRVLPPGSSEVYALEEGDPIERKEVVMRVKGPYAIYGLYETPLLGMLSHCTGWATAAKECIDAAGDVPVVSFGARHVHPLVSGRMDYAAIVGGCVGCASIDGARMAGLPPSGTVPHALILILGDTIRAAGAFDEHIDPDVPRIVLADTFRDEAEESVRVARALGDKLEGVRLDTPRERGGVTADLVHEVRARLDLEGFHRVQIVVSGGLTPERIRYFKENDAPIDTFGVGAYISGASPIDFTGDIHEIESKPVAKRGRLPGLTPNPRLKRVM